MSEVQSSPKKPVEIRLQFPIEFDGKTIDRLVVHRPKGKHVKKIKSDAGMEDMLLLACKVCEIPGGEGMGVANKVFEEMDGADCITVSEQIGNFLESGQKIGRL